VAESPVARGGGRGERHVNEARWEIVACDYCKQRNRLIAENRRNFCGRCGYPLTKMLATAGPAPRSRPTNGWLKTFLVVAAVILFLRGLSGGLSSHRPVSTPPVAASRSEPWVAENGSYFGQVSAETGRPKTVHIDGYYRGDDTYVREHFRSPPR